MTTGNVSHQKSLPLLLTKKDITLLNTLPTTTNANEWLLSFTSLLSKLVGGEERVVVDVDLSCELRTDDHIAMPTYQTQPTVAKNRIHRIISSDLSPGITWPQTTLLSSVRYPQAHFIDVFHARSRYLGTVFLIPQEGVKISQQTMFRLKSLQPFIAFTFTDLVARAGYTRSINEIFFDAIAEFVAESNLTPREQQVLGLQLIGNGYTDIVRHLGISINTVKKHVKSIHRKTGTTTYAELFARYLTPMSRLEAASQNIQSTMSNRQIKLATNRMNRFASETASQYSSVGNGTLQALNSLPATNNIRELVDAFRNMLLIWLKDIDRIAVNMNFNCNLINSELEAYDMIVIRRHFPSDGRSKSCLTVETRSSEVENSHHLLEELRLQGFPLDAYHPPIGFDYNFKGKSYLGTIILFRDKNKTPISQRTVKTIKALEPFIKFILSDLVARQAYNNPITQAFNDVASQQAVDLCLTHRQQTVFMLHLMGRRYNEIGEILNVSDNAIRRDIKNIYRKTNTSTYTELFTQYIAPYFSQDNASKRSSPNTK